MAKVFNDKSIARISKTVQRVESMPRNAAGTPDPSRSSSESFWSIITGGDMADGFSWSQIVMQDDGTWTASGGTGTNNAYPLGPISAHYGARVVMRFAGYDDEGDPLFSFVSPGHHFPVLVEKTDGDNATTYTEKADFTYTVRDIYGTTVLGTGVEVVKPRDYGPVDFQPDAGGYGVAFFDALGNLQLWDAGEVIQVTPDCDDGA